MGRTRLLGRTLLACLAGAAIAGIEVPAGAAQPKVASPAHLRASDGRDVTLPDGRTWLLTFFYGSCHTACPALLGQLVAVRAQFKAAERQKLAFGAITFDPARDTIEHLRHMADEFGLTGPGAAVMTGEPATVTRLVETFGFSFRPDGEGGFDHANLLAVMDGEGHVVAHHYGLATEAAQVARKVRRYLARS